MKVQFPFCVSQAELWTCPPATNLILSVKPRLKLGWRSGERACADPRGVEDRNTCKNQKLLNDKQDDGFTCPSITKLSSLKLE